MTFKQLTNLDRINFLKKFTAELVTNAIREKLTEKNIKIEKIKQKFIRPTPLPEQTFKKIMKTPIFESSEELEKRQRIQEQKIEQIKQIEEIKKEEKLKELNQSSQKISPHLDFRERLRRPIFHRAKTPRIIQIQKPKKSFFQRLKPKIKSEKTTQTKNPKKVERPPVEDIRKIKLEAEPRPAGFALGKIEKLLRDKTIQLIECPGPEKNLLIEKLTKINTTKISLNQEEITDIINNFSTQAKIPIMGGILKAAVGDMVISAVISEYIGSRFIIRRITPYSLLQE
tara:strand:- start:952 stop:1806 length:855 start_codon:yes stop_codon:yes gene_type:complete